MYKVGDKVVVKINPRNSFCIYDSWDGETYIETKIVAIIKRAVPFDEIDKYDYVIPYKKGWDIKKSQEYYLEYDEQFQGNVWRISAKMILKLAENKISKSNGMSCCECQTHNFWADINLKTGQFCCYSCRESKQWKYRDLLI